MSWWCCAALLVSSGIDAGPRLSLTKLGEQSRPEGLEAGVDHRKLVPSGGIGGDKRTGTQGEEVQMDDKDDSATVQERS